MNILPRVVAVTLIVAFVTTASGKIGESRSDYEKRVAALTYVGDSQLDKRDSAYRVERPAGSDVLLPRLVLVRDGTIVAMIFNVPYGPKDFDGRPTPPDPAVLRAALSSSAAGEWERYTGGEFGSAAVFLNRSTETVAVIDGATVVTMSRQRATDAGLWKGKATQIVTEAMLAFRRP